VGAMILMIEAGAFVDEEVARNINMRLSSEPPGGLGGNPAAGRGVSRFGNGADQTGPGGKDPPNRGVSDSGSLERNRGNESPERASHNAAAAAASDWSPVPPIVSQISRSAASMLARGRTANVLPNGGGRLWALKDVTGLGIWWVAGGLIASLWPSGPGHVCMVWQALCQHQQL
jgi:hypothetical protein